MIHSQAQWQQMLEESFASGGINREFYEKQTAFVQATCLQRVWSLFL
jgi:hypothetical protein